MRKIAMAETAIFIVMATMVFSDLVNARMPQKDDYVSATSTSSMGLFIVDGVVTDIGNGFVCLNSSYAEVNTGENGSLTTLWTTPRDVCIGIGTIIQLLWLNDSGNSIVQTEASLSVKERIKQPVVPQSVSVPNTRPQPENDNVIKWAPVY